MGGAAREHLPGHVPLIGDTDPLTGLIYTGAPEGHDDSLHQQWVTGAEDYRSQQQHAASHARTSLVREPANDLLPPPKNVSEGGAGHAGERFWDLSTGKWVEPDGSTSRASTSPPKRRTYREELVERRVPSDEMARLLEERKARADAHNASASGSFLEYLVDDDGLYNDGKEGGAVTPQLGQQHQPGVSVTSTEHQGAQPPTRSLELIWPTVSQNGLPQRG